MRDAALRVEGRQPMKKKRDDETIATVCAFGERFAGPHPLCEAELRRIVAQYDAEIAAGKYDADGYTVKDRKQQRKKAARR